ncbi:MAG: tetratricopeptide repeat protein [Planctomycetaceae bacterium]
MSVSQQQPDNVRQQDAARSPQRRRRWLPIVLVGAAVCVTAIVAARPIAVWYQLRLGGQALAEHDIVAAEQHFASAERIDPNNADVQFRLARVCRRKGEFQQVREHLDRAKELGYRDPPRLEREWWLALAQAGFINQVEPYYPQMLANPGDDGAEICDAFVTGFCLNLRFGEAIALLNAWQSDFPDDYRPHLRRGQIFAGQKDWAQARQHFEAALALSADDPVVLKSLAEALHSQSENDLALKHLTKALERTPDDIETLLCAADVQRDRREPEQAVGYLRRVLKSNPGHFPARLLLAKLQLAAGQTDEAARLAEELVREWPEDFAANYLLAQALRAVGQKDRSEELFARYAELMKVRPEIDRLQREVETHPDNVNALFHLGELMLRHVSREEGVSWLEAVFYYEPGHAGAHRALAEYFSGIGDQAAANRHLAELDAATSPAGHEASGAAKGAGE